MPGESGRGGVSGYRPALREPRNVDERIERDCLVRRNLAIRLAASEAKIAVEHWNRAHPGEPPMDTDFEDAVIAWCDGLGPLPEMPAAEGES